MKVKPLLVLVTGQFRSGTSRTAQTLHHLGFPAAVTISAPIPPEWFSDWEDIEAVRTIYPLAPFGRAPTREERASFRSWFAEYLERRYALAETVERARSAAFTGVCCKCPLYALFLPEVFDVAKAIGWRLRLVVCARDQGSVDRSVHATYGPIAPDLPPRVLESNRLIREALRFAEDVAHLVIYERWATYPDAELGALGEFVGAVHPPQ